MKILGSDFDGTLTVGGINETKCQAIRQWREAGHLFGIVSGRGPRYLRPLLEQYPTLELDYFVAFNGAIILDAQGRILDDTKCSEVPPAELAAALHGWGCPFATVNSEQSYLLRKEDEPLGTGEYRLWELPAALPYFHQVSVQLRSPAEASAVTQKVKDTYGDKLNPLQNDVCIDIVASTVNKAYGLRRVADLFGGKEADIIAVGDHINDLDMLRAFPSYAMENGVDAAKAAAGRTVASVVELILRELG